MHFLQWCGPPVQSESSWLSHNSHAIVTPVGTFCLAGWHHSLQDLRLDKTGDKFSSPEDCTAPPSTVKTRHQGGSFWLISSLISLYIGYMMSSAIGSYHLLLEQPKGRARTYTVWGASGASLTSSSGLAV